MRKPWFECHLFRFSRGYICVLGRIWFDLIWFVFLTSCWYSEIGRLARLALLVSIEIRNRYISMYQFYVQASMSATVVTTGSLATRNRFSQQEEGVNNTSILRDVQAFYSTLWWHTLGQLALSFPPSARWRAEWWWRFLWTVCIEIVRILCHRSQCPCFSLSFVQNTVLFHV